jgi:hypothetical protein
MDEKGSAGQKSAACKCFFSVASCNSDQILGGVFLATCGDLSASLPDPLS